MREASSESVREEHVWQREQSMTRLGDRKELA